MNQVRYRTEAFSGTGERVAAEVMAFETFELGNTDILEYLSRNILKNPDSIEKCNSFIRELEDNGFVDDMPTDDKTEFFRQVLAEVEKETGVAVKYALWLADKNAVTNRAWYGRDMVHDEDFDCYEVGPVILSDLGYDGTLYGYTEMPVCLEDRIEDLRDRLTDIINTRETDGLSQRCAEELDKLYLAVDRQIQEIDVVLSSKGLSFENKVRNAEQRTSAPDSFSYTTQPQR